MALDDRRRILVTGAGGAAAVTLIRTLSADHTMIAADMDPLAVGLYLVDRSDRHILPRADDAQFLEVLLETARRSHADLVIPTVDAELLAVSQARGQFSAHGITLLVETVETLELCLDKAQLVARCAPHVRVPLTRVIDKAVVPRDLADFGTPLCAKPRAGAGGRGFVLADDAEELLRIIPRDGSMIAQEYLPGTEYSIDVLARADGHVVASVPRARDKVDSGIAIAGRTVSSEPLETFGRDVARAIGATTVVNVQARLAADGNPALLEVNARFPGTMALTQAAGVDMPTLAVEAALGQSLPDHVGFDEVAMVRHWQDVVVPLDEYPSDTP